jgi:hypothetical protein
MFFDALQVKIPTVRSKAIYLTLAVLADGHRAISVPLCVLRSSFRSAFFVLRSVLRS